MFSKKRIGQSTSGCSEKISRLQTALRSCDAVVIGAGAGLSAAAGFSYSGARFEEYFSDFERKFGIHDMYSGGFYPFPTEGERWAYWSRHIWINRYQSAPKPVYERLLALVGDKDYFVLTTNVDHQFQKAGFDKRRLFYTQGDYGLLQCSEPCCRETYDNETAVRKMLEAQGYEIGRDNNLTLPEGATRKTAVPTELLPRCPRCGKPMAMNLRCDDTFAEDDGWHRAAERYGEFLRTYGERKIVYLELGVGFNTPVIIKYPFWQRTARNPQAIYACINQGQAACPQEIAKRSICIDGDIGAVLEQI